MTDTPRTRDELLGIFADGQGPASINPQDMRDLIASFTNPVAGFPLGGSVFNRYMGADLSGGSVVLPASSPGAIGAARLLPLAARIDPNGWLSNSYTLAADDPNSAWGVAIGAGQAPLLPYGLYSVETFAYFGLTPLAFDAASLEPIEADFDQMTFDRDYSGGDVEGVLWSDYYGPFMSDTKMYRTFTTGNIIAASSRVMVVNDTLDPKPFAPVAYTVGHASVTITYVTVNLFKVA